MALEVLLVRALIASPGDVPDERSAVRDVIAQWNATHIPARRVVVEAVMWESHSTPSFGSRPQEVLNEQLGAGCDFLIGVFWTKFGTHTGVAESGTVEEIEEFEKSGKPILLYFSDKAVQPGSVNLEQYQRVLDYKAQIKNKSLYHAFSDLAQFREAVARHLNDVVEKIVEQHGWIGVRQAPQPEAQKSPEEIFLYNFNRTLNKFEVSWSSERDSEPMSLDEAQVLLQLLVDTFHEYAALAADILGPTISVPLRNFATRAKTLSRHQVYLDGGVSYDAFWAEGDALIVDMQAFASRLSGASD